jgi:4-amino-4-deoxy-L-arabinose transferase-like glycosyltransferase
MTMNAVSMPIKVAPQPRFTWLQHRLFLGVKVSTVLLGCIALLAAFLYFYNLDAVGDGNQYYTAAVKSMLQSWYNFFFVAAEPGGSLTVDKPPLGLWLETVSAFFFGVNGFAVVLPNVLAGLASIMVIYAIVQKRHGEGAGLIAALTIAVTPVAIAAQRNNTVDGMLTFGLVLAAWAFLKATETGKLRYLWLGALLVGVGFNIKMLQAFLPLPAFFALYFLGAKAGIGRKILHLLLAFGIVLVTSLWWVAVVDLTPSDQRPYVGGTDENLMLELIVQHNGINRLLGRNGGSSSSGGRSSSNSSTTGEVGEKGILRFWQSPLSAEMSWLLPFALLGMVVLVLGHKISWPIALEHQEFVLWGGWLVTCLVFFSMADHYHAYYLVTLVPPLGVLVGITVADLWQHAQNGRGWALVVLVGAVALTVAYQWINAGQYNVQAPWLFLGIAGCVIGALVIWMPFLRCWRPVGVAVLVLSMMVVPLTWSWLTNQYGQVGRLPRAYQGTGRRSTGGGSDAQSSVNETLLAYLEANTTGVKYLVAVQSAMVGSPYVLATGRPVLYMGGFAGDIPVVSVDDVAALVAAGDLRYILGSGGGVPGGRSQNSITAWASAQCTRVQDFGTSTGGSSSRSTRRVNNGVLLYDCGAGP